MAAGAVPRVVVREDVATLAPGAWVALGWRERARYLPGVGLVVRPAGAHPPEVHGAAVGRRAWVAVLRWVALVAGPAGVRRVLKTPLETP